MFTPIVRQLNTLLFGFVGEQVEFQVVLLSFPRQTSANDEMFT